MHACRSIYEPLGPQSDTQIELAIALWHKTLVRDVISVWELYRVLGEVFVLDRRDGILHRIDVCSRDDIVLLRLI